MLLSRQALADYIESPRESYLINDEAVHRYDGGFVFATTSCSLGHTCVCVSLHDVHTLASINVGERANDDSRHHDDNVTSSTRRSRRRWTRAFQLKVFIIFKGKIFMKFYPIFRGNFGPDFHPIFKPSSRPFFSDFFLKKYPKNAEKFQWKFWPEKWPPTRLS